MLAWLKRDKSDHPLANDKAARKIVEGFSYRDPVKALDEANHWLASVNATPVLGLLRRFELLDLLDEATRKSQERVIDIYLGLSEDDPQSARIWATASAYWKLLGDGYLACARQCNDNAAVPATLKPKLSLLATRGLRALRNQVKWTLLRYGMLRTEIWVECGRFTILAESVDGAANEIELYAGGAAQSSPNHELMRVMMYWSAMPSGLSPVEQDLADRVVLYLTPKFRTSARLADDYDYFFDLDGSRPPLRLVRSAPVSATTRYFDVGAARDMLRAMYAVAGKAGNLPVGPVWGPAAESNVVVRVLRHLWVNWGKELPARVASRRKSDETLNSTHGFQNVLGVVAPEAVEGAAAGNVITNSWIAEDISAGGCGVVVPEGNGESLRVGVLVAFRTEAQSMWQVGIIRRVREHNYRQHHVGIQVVSTAAQVIPIRTLTGARQGHKRECGLLLGEQPLDNGNLQILARRDIFSGREPVEATFGRDQKTVILEPGGVVESGQDFDWLQYRLPEPGLDAARSAPLPDNARGVLQPEVRS